ncbi:MAG TPA: hypothetical protein VFX47_04545, partial [Gammaproteobacteria bacterium]|nr:hypothetical protein [Gammaproteobacteria bacterium]
MNAHPFLEGLRHNPDYLLQNLDFANRRGLVVRTAEIIYRQTAFLDQRMFTADTQGVWFGFDALQQIAAKLPSRTAHYIFHVGHCGSTLLSRLLAELPGCFPLREPIAFLALAMAQRTIGSPDAALDKATWQHLFDMVACLQTRCYRDSDTALVKSTSAGINLIQTVLARDTDTRALYLHVSLETYLATMLRAEANRESVRAYAPAWLADLRLLADLPALELSGLDDAQLTALAWLANRLHAERATEAFAGRVLWLDFDRLLADPLQLLRDSATFLDLDVPPTHLDTLLENPLLRRYAKDPSQSFSPATRTDELAEARQRCAGEIRAGLDWAEQLCRQVPALAGLPRHA